MFRTAKACCSAPEARATTAGLGSRSSCGQSAAAARPRQRYRERGRHQREAELLRAPQGPARAAALAARWRTRGRVRGRVGVGGGRVGASQRDQRGCRVAARGRRVGRAVGAKCVQICLELRAPTASSANVPAFSPPSMCTPGKDTLPEERNELNYTPARQHSLSTLQSWHAVPMRALQNLASPARYATLSDAPDARHLLFCMACSNTIIGQDMWMETG